MYLSLLLGIALLVLLFWLTLKVAKLILKVVLALFFILVLCVGIVAVLYGLDAREIDTLLKSDTLDLVYGEHLPVNVLSFSPSILFIDNSFVQRSLFLEVNGTMLQGADLAKYLEAANTTQRSEVLDSFHSQLSLQLLTDPNTEGYAIPSQKVFSFLHENLPPFVLRFLNFLVLPEQNNETERR